MGNQPLRKLFSQLDKVGKHRLKKDRYLFNEKDETVLDTENNNNILRATDNGNGYLYYSLQDENLKRVTIAQHRVNASTREDIEGKVVHHLDNNTYNNTRSNLLVTTQKENIRYCIDAGRRNTFSKITEEQVHKVCKLLCEGFSSSAILRKLRLNVDITTIDKIRSKKLWTSISKDYNLPEVRKVTNHNWSRYVVGIIKNINNGGTMRDYLNNTNLVLNKKEYDAFWRYYKRCEKKYSRSSTTIER